jgi:hypothetical protein
VADESTFRKRKTSRASQPLDAPRTGRRRAAGPAPARDRPSPDRPVVPVDPAVGPLARTERIARRAYELYERRGGAGGHDLQDWLEAERHIDAEDDSADRD